MGVNWTFYIETAASIKAENVTEAEDQRLTERVMEGEGFLYLPSKPTDFFINLENVKLVSREIVEEKTETVNVLPTNSQPPIEVKGEVQALAEVI